MIYYIEAQKIAANVHVKAFEYAKSFDDILKIISKTDDIDALKSIRYSLVTKLMQATTLQNLNRSKGVDLDNEKSVMASAGVNKSDINAAKKLRKYINQLTVAKKECEKRLASFGWELGYQFADDFKKVGHVIVRTNQMSHVGSRDLYGLIRFRMFFDRLCRCRRSWSTSWAGSISPSFWRRSPVRTWCGTGQRWRSCATPTAKTGTSWAPKFFTLL